jgi:U3 small nucleolar RNA-associated protein 23
MKAVIDYAKETFERRRCGHHPDETDALSTLECMSSFIVDTGKGSRNRYVVASQDDEVRRYMRGVKGVPLIYISRSVMIMEPMASSSAAVVSKEERAKFRSEIKSLAPAGSKRKRGDDEDDSDLPGDDDDDDDDDDDGDSHDDDDGHSVAAGGKRKGPTIAGDGEPKKRKKTYGPKGPNPLAAKKKSKATTGEALSNKSAKGGKDESAATADPSSEQPAKKKRKRRQKKHVGSSDDEARADSAPAAVSEGVHASEA